MLRRRRVGQSAGQQASLRDVTQAQVEHGAILRSGGETHMRTIVLAILLGASALLGRGFAGEKEKPNRAYVTAPVERGSVSTIVKATGTVNAVLMVDVGSQLSGQISDVLVNFN